jgi:long-chain acyl-CoA synthetase
VSPEGELQVKAPLLFTGYWGKPEAYTEAFTDDGWYSTGDLVELSDDGEVRIIGRLKDILITSGGKTISPQPIEVRLKASSLIDEAIVVGEGRKYLTVLLSVSDTANAMASHERTAALTDWIEEVNAELARPLQLKKFRVLPRALTSEMGELTLKGTIRRANVLNSFKALVDEMYDDDEQLQIARQARLAETDQR